MKGDRPSWSGSFARNLTKQTLLRYGTTCHICGQSGADSADHVIPRSHGGPDTLDNLRPAHRGCNTARSNQPLTASNVLVLLGPPRHVSEWLLAHRTATDLLVSDARIDDALGASTSAGADRMAMAARQAALSAAIATGARVLLVPSIRSQKRDPGVWTARGWTVIPCAPISSDIVTNADPSRVW